MKKPMEQLQAGCTNFTSDIRARMNLPELHQYIRRKSQFPNVGLATLLTTGVEKSQIASGGRSVGISQ